MSEQNENSLTGSQEYAPSFVEALPAAEKVSAQAGWRLRDFKGLVHFHSWDGSSCGRDPVDRIQQAVSKKTKLEYVGMTEHVGWPGAEYWYEKILEEFVKIDDLRKKEGTSILKGVEVNVHPDGTIDAPEELLQESEIVVASLHYRSSHASEERTAVKTVENWTKAMADNPEITILGHPLRDLPEKEWGLVDWDKLFMEAKKRNVIVELNINDAAPEKMPPEFFEALIKNDNFVVVSPDFHSLKDYLLDDGRLTQEEEALLNEYHEIKKRIAYTTFKDGDTVAGRGLFKPGYSDGEKAKKIEQLEIDRQRLAEIEDSIELKKIYDILLNKPFPLKILLKYVRRIYQLKRTYKVKSSNLINLWGKEKFLDWIASRKKSIEIIENLGQ